MTAGTLSTHPALVIAPIDYLLVDIGTGRHLPGDAIHAAQLAHEHGLDEIEAAEAVQGAWLQGFLSPDPTLTSGLVTWTPEMTARHLHQLARAMVVAVRTPCIASEHSPDLIDGEESRVGAVELFGLSTPCDLALFLELARALLSRTERHLVDEVVVPISVLFSDASRAVHGLEFAAPDVVRHGIVSRATRSLMDDRVDDFTEAVADYLVAVSVQ